MKCFAALALVLASYCIQTAAAGAGQPYPVRPVRLIVPYAAGTSSNDVIGRLVAQRLAASLGQAVLVENRAGGGGHVGSELAAKATPDGYTLLLGVTGPLAISPSVYPNLRYDPLRDFAPVARLAVVPYVLVAHPSLQAPTLAELIALAKSRPGQLKFASSGYGSSPHLCGELLKTIAGIDLLHVPYKGPAMPDVLAGRVELYCTGVTAAIPHVASGKLRAIVTTMPKRLALLPDVPTARESGVAAFDVASWIGVVVPAKTPTAIVDQLYRELEKIAADPEFQQSVASQGSEVALQDPRQFGAYLKAELEKWRKIVRAANIKLE